jgi:hypothetical protein
MKCLGIERTRSKKKLYTDIRFLVLLFLKIRCTTCISLQLKTITVQRANRRKPGLISFSVFQTHEIWLSFYGVHYQYSCVLILRSIPLRSVTVCIGYCRSLLGHLLGHSPADMFMLSYWDNWIYQQQQQNKLVSDICFSHLYVTA